MLKLLDLYLLKRFTSRILFLIVALSAVILITNLVEMIDNFVDANMNSNEIFNYYILTLPMIISYAIPMSITLSTVLSLVAYIKNNELLALRALGINYFRLSSSIIITSIFISFFHFYFENSIVSNSTRLKNKIVRTYNLDKKNHKKTKTNFIEDLEKNKSIYILNYNNKNKTANKIVIKEINDDNEVIRRLDSDLMKWNAEKWTFEELLIREWFDKNETFRIAKDTSIFLGNIKPLYLTSEFIEPEEMNYFELNKFIKIKEKNAGNTTKWKVGLYHKIAYSFSSLFLCITAITFTLLIKNSNVSYGIGLSLLIITLYYVLLIIGKNFGIEGIISPWISAWLPNISMLIISAFSFKKFIF